VLQWGDLSYSSNKIGEFLTGPKKFEGKNLRMIKPIMRVGVKVSKSSTMDSRTMKLQSLSALYSRDHSIETFNEMMEEMESMRKYDQTFNKFAASLSINGNYDAKEINFECLRESINSYEAKCGKFSDYGLGYIKYIAQACQVHASSILLEHLKC
jgi:hypothetical protein